mgnify:CR=1 FL=1
MQRKQLSLRSVSSSKHPVGAEAQHSARHQQQSTLNATQAQQQALRVKQSADGSSSHRTSARHPHPSGIAAGPGPSTYSQANLLKQAIKATSISTGSNGGGAGSHSVVRS